MCPNALLVTRLKTRYSLNSFPNDKFKAFADDNLDMAKTEKIFFDRVENIVGKGENAGHQHFLLFPYFFFKNPALSGSVKVSIVW